MGEGPTGVVVLDALDRLYVLNKFEGSVSEIGLSTETEIGRVPFHDPSPAAIKVGRKHLYDTHKNSGLGQIACASCHVDARMDRLSWDLGDPSGSVKTFDQNCPDGGCEDWHPMKGPMLTQTLQDIIGKEPFHWRGDRFGLEEFAGAFQGLQGDDQTLTAQEMQEYEDFLATVHFPPNPFRNLDNTLPASMPLDGHFTTGRFGPAGLPLGPGDAQRGLDLYRPPNLLDGVACVTCHTLPTGMGPDGTFSILSGFQPIPPGRNGEHHLALVSVDGSTNVSMKVPHLRNLYDRVGFEVTQTSNLAGFGFLHDGSVDSIAHFVSEPVFAVQSDQDVADLVAFMLAFSGSDLPQGSTTNPLEMPGVASLDSHAAVGRQTTLVDVAGASASQLSLISTLLAMADAGEIGVTARGPGRGYAYLGGGQFQSDRTAEVLSTAALQALASVGSEITFTAVPFGSETRIGVDRDGDGHLDLDEVDAGSDPADAASTPAACTSTAPTAPDGLAVVKSGACLRVSWNDQSNDEVGFHVERAPFGSGQFVLIGTVSSDANTYDDGGVQCGQAYEYRVSAFNCAGPAATAPVPAVTRRCLGVPVQDS